MTNQPRSYHKYIPDVVQRKLPEANMQADVEADGGGSMQREEKSMTSQ